MGAEKTWCGGVNSATGAGYICKCAEPCPCWVRGTVKSLKWRLVFTKDQYSAHCSSSLCLKPYHEFRSVVPLEDLYADDLVIIAESLEECVRRLLTCKEAMEKKGLRVNAGKTKIMICGTGLDL